MARQDEWESTAQELGVVLMHILDEFDEMCRKSGHAAEAKAALAHLNAMLGAEVDRSGVEPAAPPSSGGTRTGATGRDARNLNG